MCYDNDRCAIYSFNPAATTVDVIVRGECKGLRDFEAGKVYTEHIALPLPSCMMDAVNVIDEPQEYCYQVNIGACCLMLFEIMK